jgi:very-short-patch-repair endonuclease
VRGSIRTTADESAMRSEQPWKTNRARVLRANTTAAESKLWHALRNRNLAGHRFARQVAIDTFFVDFLCREARLIVEVDGATHGEDDERQRDASRAAALERRGYRIVRVTNEDVVRNLDGVLDGLLRELERDEA